MVHVSQGSCTMLSHQHRSDPCKMCTGQIHETNDWSNIELLACVLFYYYSHCFFLNIVCTSHKGMKYEICTHTKPYLYLQYGSFSKMIPEEYCKVLDENHHFQQENLCCQVLEAETMGFRAWVPMLREVPMQTLPSSEHVLRRHIYIYVDSLR